MQERPPKGSSIKIIYKPFTPVRLKPLVISSMQLQNDKKFSGRDEKGRSIILRRLKRTIYPPSFPIPISPEIMESSTAVRSDGVLFIWYNEAFSLAELNPAKKRSKKP